MRLTILLLAAVLTLSSCAGEDEAKKANKKAIDSNSSDITLRLAHASEDAGDFPAAEKLYKQATGKGDVQPYIELAQFYDRHHGERQALTALNSALKIEPDNTDIMRGIANVHVKLGEASDALKVLDEAMEIKSNDALLYNSKGVALDMLGRYTHARNAYSTAISLDPADAMMFNANLGMSYISNKEYKKAISLLRPLADMPESTPQVRQNLSLAYGLSGDNDNAIKYGSKDLPAKDAEANMRFYKLFTDREGKSSSEKSAPPVSDKVTAIPPIP